MKREEQVGVGALVQAYLTFVFARPHHWLQAIAPAVLFCLLANFAADAMFGQQRVVRISIYLTCLALMAPSMQRAAVDWRANSAVRWISIRRFDTTTFVRTFMAGLICGLGVIGIITLVVLTSALAGLGVLALIILIWLAAALCLLSMMPLMAIASTSGVWPALKLGVRLGLRAPLTLLVMAPIILFPAFMVLLIAFALFQLALFGLAADTGWLGRLLMTQGVTPIWPVVIAGLFVAAAAMLFERLKEITYGQDYRGLEEIF
ncbi:MAG: hypothetical protein AAF401_00870 [Pseudomonadota bacterium]